MANPPKIFWIVLLAIGAVVAAYTLLIDSDDEAPTTVTPTGPGFSADTVTPFATATDPINESTAVAAPEATPEPACGSERIYNPSGPKVSLGELWDETVCPSLNGSGILYGNELWTGREEYDSGHYLMVPLHAAFQLEEEGWQEQFAQHFQRYVREGVDRPLTNNNALSRLHYLYVASRFAVLAEQSGRRELIPPGLMNALYGTIHALWNRIPPPGGIRQDVRRKLDDPNSIITDNELFIFAIAADLRAHERISRSGVSSSTVGDILGAARSVLQQKVVPQEEGGWLFQPGVWAEFSEYAYAGHEDKVPGMAPFPLADVAEDTSHSHRWPLWLTSLANAYDEGDPERRFYDDLKKGLEQQFFTKVVVPPTFEFPAYRTNNFMDGRNGVYRWEYQSLGPNSGYGPYELSGTMMLGWWTFLGANRIRAVYQDMAERFPLPPRVIEVFAYPDYTQEGFPPGEYTTQYQTGLYELIARLAARLPLSPTPEPSAE